MNVPIIRLEIEGMKHSILTALTNHAATMDYNIQQAIEEYCSPENIDAVIKKRVMEAIDAAVKEEIRSFFAYSNNGRLAIREAVIKWLDDIYPSNEVEE